MTDWLPELSDDDLATLLEALEAWEHKDAAQEMFTDVFDAAVGDRADARYHDTRERQKLELRRVAAVRKDRSVLLRAKLITLRDRRRVARRAH